ncbi:MAG: SUMF1/EgtB/PvdO family nonheme iron enzyme [Anaerolineae bacterium]|nr:SUMF1/EgtB/PvdO family nonheme iron enzyme [Anaerolineae bacterium]
MTDVFISYSRRNLDFVQQLHAALEVKGKSSWFDQKTAPLEGIVPGSGWWEQIKQGIVAVDNFLFVISLDSVVSPYCNAEIAYALQQERRIVTVLYCGNMSEVETLNAIDAAIDTISADNELPPSVSATVTNLRSLTRRNWLAVSAVQYVVFADNGDFDRSLNLLIHGLDTDLVWIKTLSQLRQTAKVWAETGDDSYLWSEARIKPVLREVNKRGLILSEQEREFLRSEVERLTDRLQNVNLDHANRARIGERLHVIGDTRPGVGLRPDGLPDIVWCSVPGGEIEIEGQKFQVDQFEIAKYPITYVQFQAFIDADYGFDYARWWDGLAADDDHQCRPSEQYHKFSNHPRECASWYDAVVFCRWLSEKMGEEIRLPTEWEWQQAATGGNPNHEYPWGPHGDSVCCNVSQSGLGRTTAVGMYLPWASPVGALDMAGNVWEWCLNDYERPTNIELTDNVRRAARGGSWAQWLESACCICRLGLDPNHRYHYIGFRVMRFPDLNQRVEHIPFSAQVEIISPPRAPADPFGFLPVPFQWVEIPAGQVTLDGDHGTFDVPAFSMAKYPITNAQFEVFVNAKDGYQNIEWWTYSDAALQWRLANTTPQTTTFAGDDLPRTDVNWYEAVAFCRWLSAQTGEKITLPTEQQWQYTAQQGDSRRYPWGDQFDPTLCNTKESGIKRTTPVARYLDGVSPSGVLDMGGNVWEWCLNEDQTPANTELVGAVSRAVRGGSWFDDQKYARCTMRYGYSPHSRDDVIGFRVVRFLDFDQPAERTIVDKPTAAYQAPSLIRSRTGIFDLLSAPFQWVEIPAGQVTLEDDHGTFDVLEFAIARYPITNAQFDAFVNAEYGYAHVKWWTYSNKAREWFNANSISEATGFTGNDLPRTNVSWYAAVAFCQWLSAHTGLWITLPTEQQWQRAAQGDDNRRFPWGDQFDLDRCNTAESDIKQVTSVTSYLNGASPYGVLNMIGNVSEWCLNKYDFPTNVELDSRVSRAVRGGSWFTNQKYSRCAYRGWSFPFDSLEHFGFRVVRVSHL